MDRLSSNPNSFHTDLSSKADGNKAPNKLSAFVSKIFHGRSQESPLRRSTIIDRQPEETPKLIERGIRREKSRSLNLLSEESGETTSDTKKLPWPDALREIKSPGMDIPRRKSLDTKSPSAIRGNDSHSSPESRKISLNLSELELHEGKSSPSRLPVLKTPTSSPLSSGASSPKSPANSPDHANRDSPTNKDRLQLEKTESNKSLDRTDSNPSMKSLSTSNIRSESRCKEKLKAIYLILEEKDLENGLYKRNSNFYLNFDSKKKGLYWNDQKSSEGTEKEKFAIIYVLSSLLDALKWNISSFSSQSNIFPTPANDVEVMQLHGWLFQNSSTREILFQTHPDKRITELIVQLHFYHLNQHQMQSIDKMLLCLKDILPSIEFICLNLTQFQIAEIEQIKKECPNQFIEQKLFENPREIHRIINRLGMNEIILDQDKSSLDHFSTMFYSEPQALYGFFNHKPERFLPFFNSCMVKFEGYIECMNSILEEDPKEKYPIPEYYIRMAKSYEEVVEDSQESQLKGANLTPCISRLTRDKAQEKEKLMQLLQWPTFIEGVKLLTDKSNNEIQPYYQNFTTMLCQLCFKSIKFLDDKGILNECEYEQMRISLLNGLKDEQLKIISDCILQISAKLKYYDPNFKKIKG